MIDLHTHSTFSDGTLTPSELIALAEQRGLTAVALTDHDTVAGLPEAVAAAQGRPLRFVPGVELSAEIAQGALHIVGLFIDPGHAGLTELLEEATDNRNRRNVRIIDRLNDLGMPITLDEVEEEATIGTVGRPHFASVLTRHGHTRSIREAFVKYLAKTGAAYFPKVRIPQDRAIETIRSAGGLAVLAHPDQTRLGGQALADFVAHLKGLGLDAVETHYSGYTRRATRKLAKLARRLGLQESGGSDFHGAVKPGLALGTGPGDLHVPDALLPPLLEIARQRGRGIGPPS